MMVSSIVGGAIYGWLIGTRGISVASSSKTTTGFGFFLACAMFLFMGQATSVSTASLLSSLVLGSLGLARGGWGTNHVEIAAPEHAAMLYSVGNCVSSAMSAVGLPLTGKLLDDFGGAKNSLAWTAAMGSIGVLVGLCGLYYVILAQGNEILFPAVSAAPEVSNVVENDALDESEGV